MRIYRFLLAVAVVLVMSACAASRKTAVSTSETASDSVSVSAVDSVRRTAEKRASAAVIKSDSSFLNTSTREYGDNEEMITEHITETTDAAGNKTTTTDRTTHRKGSYDRQTDNQEWRHYQEEQTNLWLSRLDSMANSRFAAVGTHWQSKDSLNTSNEKNTKDIKAHSCRWWDGMILFLVLCFVAWYAWRYGQENK